MFRGGLLLFIVLVISMFVVTQVWVNDAASQLKLVHVSTELCTSSVATAVRARELYLDGTAVMAAIPRGVAAWEASMATLLQAGNDTLMDMQAFQTQLNTLFNADQPSHVSAAWTARSVKLRKLVAAASLLAFVNETVNPYDAASTVLARAAAMARFQAESLATAPTLPSWRLVFDNAVRRVVRMMWMPLSHTPAIAGGSDQKCSTSSSGGHIRVQGQHAHTRFGVAARSGDAVCVAHC